MKNTFFSTIVSFVQDSCVKHYCLKPPFDPPEFYPELSFIKNTDTENKVYPMVRNLLIKLGMDREHIGTKFWNPFIELVEPGNVVLIKPNLITHRHYLGYDALYSSIVHGSTIRPIIDYVWLALAGRGSIIIADNPIVGTDFVSLMHFTGLEKVVRKLSYRDYNDIKILDLRPRVLKEAMSGEFYYVDQQGDPLGYIDIDLGSDSLFSEFDNSPNTRYYTLADPSVNNIDPNYKSKSETDNFHYPRVHKYTMSKTVLNSDVLISFAKLKTHCKAGVTLTLKNMVGTVYGKGCMPHWRPGPPPDGDAFRFFPPLHYAILQKLYVKLRRSLRIHRFPCFRRFRNYLQRRDILVGQYKHLEHGNWMGNDTLWRTILDLNRIAIYSDKSGNMRDTPQRRYFGLIDGIIGQEGEGPMNGKPVKSSIILGGFNPVAVDSLAVKAMGINLALIKSISNAGKIKKWKLIGKYDFEVSPVFSEVPILNFVLPKGWN